MDYLIEEVLRKQSLEVQDFLLKTSILERFTAPLCNIVTGRADSHNMLLKIERENLFIVPLDESRQWYRYEHLFTELLRHQLEITSGIKTIEELHRLASQWYEDRKLSDEAIHHALAARDWERAMRLISLPEVSMPRRISMTMLKWLEAIPRELLLKNERLRSLYLWELMVAGQYEAAEPILKNLEQLAPDNKPLQGEVALARAQMSYNTVNAEKYAKEALSLLPAGNIASRGVANMILGINYVNRGLFNEAEPILREAYESLQRVGMIAVASSPLTFLGIITMLRGKFHQAEKIYRQAIDIAGPSSLAGLAHMYYSYLYLEWNELEAAEFEMDKALELVTFLSTHAQGVAYHYMTRIQLARGDIEGANTSLERADRILSEKEAPPADRARNAAFHVLFAREQRDAKSVSIWLDKLSEYEEFFPVDIPLNAVYLLFGRKSRTAALERLSSDYERFKKDGLNYYAMGARLAQVVYSTKPEPALTYLAEVLHTGRTEGFIRIFLESGIEFAPLLHQAIARGIETEYAQKLLNIIEFEEERRKLRTITPVRDILSERELEVLRLIAIGLSNKDIAGKLVISLNTTKTHIRHLFEKLEVKGRTRAIARAKELKLI
jgi:LuxR family maltose regulon positive regulatory protein